MTLPRPFFPALLTFALLAGGCASTGAYVGPLWRGEPDAAVVAATAEPAFEVLLVGDVGATSNPADAEPVLDALAARLQEAGPNSAVVFLGDQLPDGLPDSSEAGRAEAEARLDQILAAVRGHEERVYFLPGDRDWAGGDADVLGRQEAYLEGALGRDDAFLPGSGLPGPVLVDLGEDDGPLLVALDTPWWFLGDDRPTGEVGDFDVENEADVLSALDAVLRDNDERNVLVVGHHPVFSNGPRAGRYPLSTHLLPPVLGSIGPFFRTFVGGPQDLANPTYRALRQALEEAFEPYDGVVYAAAHEHALEVFRADPAVRRTQHYVVSGSAADADPVGGGRGAAYAHGARGFVALRYAEDGSAALDVVEVHGSGGSSSLGGEVAATAALRGPFPDRVDPDLPEDTVELPRYADSTVTAAADSSYLAGPLREFFLGRGYRDAWGAPVTAPVLDFDRDYGGLTPTQRGGGMQTVSLRLAGGDGHEYQLRLLRKVPGQTLPAAFQNTVAADAVQEQTAATNPYAALPAAVFADAAGLYHTNPRIVYVPDDERLGIYREDFAGQLALIEERPDERLGEFGTYGEAEEAVSPGALYEELDGDNDHRVDQQAFLRARLLDLLFSDWDRHVDQWRWAAFEPGQLDSTLAGDDATRGKVYRPIPRDRDFAFYRVGGLFPGLAKYVEIKLQNYEEDFGDIEGLTYSGIPQDRRFLNALPREVWEEEARSLQAALTDSVAEAAFRTWPTPVYERYAEEALADWRERREHLPRAALKFYRLRARIVDVLGSNKGEVFVVTRLPDGRAEVAVFDRTREGEAGRELYRRTFLPDETDEVRLYGLRGRDVFRVEGDGPGEVGVRIVGGAGADVLEDRNEEGRLSYYDTAAGNEVVARGGASVRLSDDPGVNRYDPFEYRLQPNTYPTVAFAYNKTDGLYLGGGFAHNRPGFRRRPWGSTYVLDARVSTATGGVDARYASRHYAARGSHWDLALDARYATPQTVLNFYGLSNESEEEDALDPSFYQVRIARGLAGVGLLRRVENAVAVRFGPTFLYADVEEDSARFAVGAPGVRPEDFEPQLYAGAAAEAVLSTVDSEVNPRQGYRWINRAAVNVGLDADAATFAPLSSALSLYLSPSLYPQLTLAGRVGAGYNVGDFPFFAAQTLGGTESLRGYRRERFAGRSALFTNLEVRAKLFDLSTYLAPLEVGALAFGDNGRVWADDEDSRDWHLGYGGGLWLAAFNRFVVTGTVGQSKDGTFFTAGLGFLY